MDETTVKTRTGLILEGCVAAALRRTKYRQFDATPKYGKESMTPDFLIPNEKSPKYFIEVTQTEIRDSFRMKTLRYFESVCNAKAHFGNDVISVNILMGDPFSELPANNIQVMYAFFDVNLNPRSDARSVKTRRLLSDLEAEVLHLARDESIATTEKAISGVVASHSSAIDDLAILIGTTLDSARTKPLLDNLWNFERNTDIFEYS